MFKWLQKAALITLLLSASNTYAFYYCSGKITGLVTRTSSEDTQVAIEGMSGLGQLGLGGIEQKEMHKRQFAMLLSAWMAGKKVLLEMPDSGNCTDAQPIRMIRFVHLSD